MFAVTKIRVIIKQKTKYGWDRNLALMTAKFIAFKQIYCYNAKGRGGRERWGWGREEEEDGGGGRWGGGRWEGGEER